MQPNVFEIIRAKIYPPLRPWLTFYSSIVAIRYTLLIKRDNTVPFSHTDIVVDFVSHTLQEYVFEVACVICPVP